MRPTIELRSTIELRNEKFVILERFSSGRIVVFAVQFILELKNTSTWKALQ